MLNFALVGCGKVSRKHVDALTNLPNARLVAVCDEAAAIAEATAKPIGLPYFSDYNEMLKRVDIDVVTVLTPSGMHARHVLDILDRRKHVVVEKPLALTVEDAEAMIRKADRQRCRLFVVKQNRFNRPVRRLREEFEAGRFGKLVMGTVRVRWCRDQRYYDEKAWRGTWALDGGVMANQASHHIDLLQWFLGDVETVFCYTAARLVNIEVEDTAVAVLRFVNGAVGVIEATTATRPKDLEGSLTVMGENGSVEIAGFAVNRVRTWKFADSTDEEEAAIIRELNEAPPNPFGYNHEAFLADVVDSIENDRAALVDGLEGMKSLVLLHALYESAFTGQEVRLRFRPRWSRLGRRTAQR